MSQPEAEPSATVAEPIVEEKKSEIVPTASTFEVPSSAPKEPAEAAMSMDKPEDGADGAKPATSSAFRDPALMPIKKLSVSLIKTYKRINEVFLSLSHES